MSVAAVRASVGHTVEHGRRTPTATDRRRRTDRQTDRRTERQTDRQTDEHEEGEKERERERERERGGERPSRTSNCRRFPKQSRSTTLINAGCLFSADRALEALDDRMQTVFRSNNDGTSQCGNQFCARTAMHAV